MKSSNGSAFTAVVAVALAFGLWSCQPSSAPAKTPATGSFANPKWDTLGGVSSGTLLRGTFKSKFVSDRDLDIWLPDGYDGKRKHAVLYMYDGQMLFNASTTWNHQEWRVDETIDSLLSKHAILPTIVVGLHNGGAQRNFEYFPQKPFEQLPPSFADSLSTAIAEAKGAAAASEVSSDLYLRYLVEEIKPMVDAQFATYTLPSTTVIAGSSMGGLMSMYAALEYPNIFGTALCLSTHWPGGFAPNNEVPNAMVAYMSAMVRPELGQKFYFDLGTETLDGFYAPYQSRIDSLMHEKGMEPGTHWLTKIYAGDAHDERSWAARLHVPLLFALEKQR